MFKLRAILCLCMALSLWKDVTSAKNYCNQASCTSGSHTLCRYSSKTPASTCGTVLVASLSDGDRNTLVNLHNKYRQLVASGNETKGNPGPQPAATNMATIAWDKELETVAQRWAIQCNFGHDTCRSVDRFPVGQNVAIRSSKGLATATTLKMLVDLWYNEVKLFDRSQVSKYRYVAEVGHYTQMVWAKTHLIGCGVIRYIDANEWNTTYLVCNYGTAGNVIGQPIYNTN